MEEAIRMADATKVLPHKPTTGTRSKSKPQAISSAQVWLLLRRMMVVAAAVLYVTTSLDGGLTAVKVLYGVIDDLLKYDSEASTLIASYAGKSTIAKSKLVKAIGGTASRDDTVYLLSASAISNVSCPQTDLYIPGMYSNEFLRTQYADLVRDTAYNITLFTTSELIAPIVDCSTHMLRSATSMYMRVFYLLRDKTDPTLVTLMASSFSIQDYRFPDQYQTGVAGVLALSVVTDMRFSEVDEYYYALTLGYPFRKASYSVFELRDDTADGYRGFESVLTPGSTDVTRMIYTSFRRGIYNTEAEMEQCNIRNVNLEYDMSPIAAMADWKWVGISILKDAWTWVHVMHFIFAADMIFNLSVLLLVIYRNLRKGKFWIGDAFVSFSRSVVFRGAMVVFSWYLDGFWTLMEFCIQDSKVLANLPKVFIYEQIFHADLLVIYLSLTGLLGFAVRERIDPALSVFLFEIGFTYRIAIIQWFPTVTEKIAAYALNDISKGLVPVPARLVGISPLRFRTTHEIHPRPVDFIVACMTPVLLTFGLLVLYAPLRKVYRRYFPDRMIKLSRGTDMSTECEAILAWKCSLTMFEVATGAALQNRVGLVSDYDNCVYIKGMKFASADGIYCNGFVVANGKWLMHTNDLPLILMMVVARVRLADVYVYEVETYTVQKNARLFYPEMMTFTELFQLNTMILA